MEYNRNGVRIQLNKNNIARDGLEKLFHENGQKMAEICWKNGLRHGLSIRWWENGQKAFEDCWQEGILHGTSCSWFEHGQKRYEKIFHDGKLKTATAWMPNGKKCTKTNIRNGHGTLVYYGEDGSENYTDYKYGMDTESRDYEMYKEENVSWFDSIKSLFS